MGLLALDITAHGVVMSADSQPVEILDGNTRVLPTAGQRRRNSIVPCHTAGFCGVLGWVGTEYVGAKATSDWTRDFAQDHGGDTLPEFCVALAEALTREWRHLGIRSVLEIFVSGVENGEVRFWYVRNSQGLYDQGWIYKQGSDRFVAVDDLDPNYIARDLEPGQTKEDLLRSRIYSFRQGELLPAGPVFDAFGQLLNVIYSQGIAGFEPIQSLDDLAYYARQRMEFLKRLYSPQHGIYKGSQPPLDGMVYVVSVSRAGEILEHGKHRGQAAEFR